VQVWQGERSPGAVGVAAVMADARVVDELCEGAERPRVRRRVRVQVLWLKHGAPRP
jgi:hypothetical protein